nr:GON-4-like protein [Peromyscus maniculatus bairdii]
MKILGNHLFSGTKRKRDGKGQEQGTVAHDLKLDDVLDRTLEDGAKQYNLTAINVRNILHEVITNEHVVAMMKAAISETEDMPLFVSSPPRHSFHVVGTFQRRMYIV